SNNTFGSAATNFTMTNGRFRCSQTGQSPNMGGTYSLTGGVVEFYSSQVTAQTINTKAYFNIEVSGNNVANSSGNITLNSGGSFTVKSTGVFTINDDAITGPSGSPQSVIIENGGRFKTGDVNGFSGATGTSINTSIETITLNTGSIVEYSRTSPQFVSGSQQITNGQAYQNLVLSGTDTKTAPSGTLLINENLSKTSVAVFAHNDGTVEFNNTTTAQTYNSVAPEFTFNHLNVNNSSASGFIAQSSLGIEGALTFGNNAKLDVGNSSFVSFLSTSTKTGRLASLPSTASIVYTNGGTNGKFVVERYFPGRRAWRLITAPVTVTASNTFFNSWQIGGNNTPGSGTYISGPSANQAANGLDPSPLNNASLKKFNQTTSQFDNVLNTRNATALISGTTGMVNNGVGGNTNTPDNVGYFMFIRGDRTALNVNAFYAYGSVLSTTIRDTGRLQVQAYRFPANTTVGGYTLIGNPYASPVDFANLTLNNVANKFWSWDPNLNIVGGYVLLDAGTAYNPVKVPVSSSGTVAQTQVIQSSQAFVVETTGASTPYVQFDEVDKSTTNNLNIFRPTTPNGKDAPSMAINIHLKNETTPVNELADGTLVQFAPEFSNETDILDGIKFGNVNENFGLMRNSKFLALERRQPIQEGDTIFLRLTRSTQRNYSFEFIADQIATDSLNAWLEDRYTNTYSQIALTGSTWFNFSINSDAASARADRFRIVFKKLVKFVKVSAAQQDRNVVVNWVANGEYNLNTYQVERSYNGIDFTPLGSVQGSGFNSGNATYAFTDVEPTPGKYYYRIKALGNGGIVAYSNTAMVDIAKIRSGLFVSPNPVTGNVVQLHLNDLPAAKYNLQLTNALGQIMNTSSYSHQGGLALVPIQIPSLPAGVYHLEITDGAAFKSVIKVKIK
ncbi:MAG: T9SS type A sorting domain-containing protein, partial [Ferruginibacter sp.]